MTGHVKPSGTLSRRSEQDSAGRAAQRRRTRKAIVEATVGLLSSSEQPPSIAEIAAAADVSRRTVYAYFPTVEHLLIDATLGLLSESRIDSVLAATRDGDPRERVAAMIRAIAEDTADTMHLGRRLIKLTIEAHPDQEGPDQEVPDQEVPDQAGSRPRRGYRRVGWLEKALEPLRDQLSEEGFARLVSSLAMVVGWEAMVVLRDIRGLDDAQATDTSMWAALALVDAALAAEA